MRWALILSFIAADALFSAASADCICRSQGRDYELGQSVCLASPKGPRIATCGMVLNNTSWQFSETPCVISQAAGEPVQTAQAHSHHHHHGDEATVMNVSRASP